MGTSPRDSGKKGPENACQTDQTLEPYNAAQPCLDPKKNPQLQNQFLEARKLEHEFPHALKGT